jgi:hypothetical protein
MQNILSGGCFCGSVKFLIKDKFKDFYQCHCKQCQQLTGSAFASNILTDPGNIQWLKGHESIALYEHPTRVFSKSFCKVCGSGLPYINQSKTSLVIPAGSLNEPASINPQANIFKSEEAYWFRSGLKAKNYNGFKK